MYSRYLKSQQECISITLILSSVRPHRNADRICAMMKSLLRSFNCRVEVIDPLIIGIPLLDVPYHYYPDKNDIPEWLNNLNKSIQESDALIFLTTEYNRAVPPPLINLIDFIPFSSYEYKPASIITYSVGAGGGSALDQLRSILSYLGCIITPLCPSIMRMDEKITSNGEIDPKCIEKRSLILMCQQLQYITHAIRSWRRKNKSPPIKLLV